MKALIQDLAAFIRDDDGVVMTEYLVLLAMLVGGTLLAIITTGQNLSDAWNAWAGFFLLLAGRTV